MNEMNAEEKTAFELRIKSDPDLLIEVESLKGTMNKVGRHPEFKAPLSAVQFIKSKNKVYLRTKRLKALATGHPIKLAATVAALGLSFSFGWYYQNSNTILNTPQSRIVIQQPQNSTNINSWTDNNKVISIERINSGSPELISDSLILKHAKKLRMVNPSVINSSSSSDVMLTRTTRP